MDMDETLLNLVNTGTQFATGMTEVGRYTFYTTQTKEGCEGIATVVELIIENPPIISLGNDTLIRDNQDLILGPYPDEYSYLWSNTSRKPYLEINGEELSNSALIEIIDAKGALVQKYRIKELLSGGNCTSKITLDTPGTYYLQIHNDDQMYNCKVIRY